MSYGTGSLYQRYGATQTDPAVGLTAAAKAQAEGLTGVMTGIKDLMTWQDNKNIAENTMSAQNILKQRIQQAGLGGLSAPPDMDLIAQEFGGSKGNTLNRGVLEKTISDQTSLLKNNYINQFSSEADAVLAKTQDPIAAREHFKQGLLKAGAPSVFADAEATNYDLRKAAEIKNIDTRDNQLIEEIKASAAAEAAKGGYAAGRTELTDGISRLPTYKQAATKKAVLKDYEDISKPSDAREKQIASILASHDDESTKITTARLAAIKQKNDQTRSVSSGSTDSTTEGSNPRVKSTKGNSFDLVDKDGKPTASMAETLGNSVSNWFEKLSSSSDYAKIHKMHQNIYDATGDAATSARLLKETFDAVHKGKGAIFNNLSATEIKDMEDRLKTLGDEYKGSDKDGRTQTTTSRNSSRSGNISYTDSGEVDKWISYRAKERQALEEQLREAARNESLGYKGDANSSDMFSKILKEHAGKQPIPTTATTTPTQKKTETQKSSVKVPTPDVPPGTPVKTKRGADVRFDKTLNEAGIAAVPDTSKPAANESTEAGVNRLIAIDNQRKADAAGVTLLASHVQALRSALPGPLQQQQDNREAFASLSAKLSKPKADPHVGQIHVQDSKGKNFWVPANTDLQQFNYRLYKK